MAGLLDFLQSASNSVASNVTAPVDGIAWLLRKAGIPVPDAPVGGSDWAQNAGLTRPVQQSASSLAGESLGMIAPMLIAAKAPQVARGLLQGADNLMAPSTLSKQAGVFMGPQSRTWDKAAAENAQKMADAGIDARQIWSDTGTWKGPDGAWRQEIPDNMAALRTPSDMSALAQSYKARQLEIKDLIAQSKLHPDLFPKDLAAAQKLARAESSSYKTPLTEYYGLNSPGPSGSKAKYAYDHDPLHRAYPDIGEEVVIRQGKDDGDFFGSYVNNQLDVNRSASTRPGGANSTTAHEMQHAIQGREGWAGGGNPGQFRSGGQFTPFEQYQRLAGEAEARATQARIQLNAAQRRALFPEDSYDVPIDQLIIRRDGTGSAASMPFTYPQDKALATAQRNAALPIEQGGLGLGAENTAMERAKALGFTDDAFHGSKSPEGIKNLVPGGEGGAIRHGDAYGTGVYTTTDAVGDASSYGSGGAVFPLKINRSNHLQIDAPNADDLQTLSKFAGDNMLPSDKARFSIGRDTRQFSDLQDARDFFGNQRENWKQFGDGMDRARPEAIANPDGTFAVQFTNFDAPVPITSGKDADTLLRAVGYDNVPSMGYSGHTLDRGAGRLWDVTPDTSKLRSRFAAFDPMRRNEADLLGRADPELLGLLSAGLLGYGGYNALSKP